MLRNCSAHRYAINKARMVRMTEYSRRLLNELREATGIEYEGRQLGTLQLFRTQQQVDASARDIEVLQRTACRTSCSTAPASSRRSRRWPMLLCPGGRIAPAADETGDCQLFTTRLAALAADAGVEFRYDARIEASSSTGRRSPACASTASWKPPTATCLRWAASRRDARPAGHPTAGVSAEGLLADRADHRRGACAGVDHPRRNLQGGHHPFRRRIRVGGMAEVAGYDLPLPPRRRQTLEMVVNDLYPGGGDLPSATFWTGLRPATPDGTPVIGATRYPNLWLNTGHGTLGWTMSCGSARYLADLMGGPPASTAKACRSRATPPERDRHTLFRSFLRSFPMRPARALIDLSALRHNYRVGRELGGQRALAVIKADAYGHGAARCAQALLPEADGFAVAFLEEAIALREAGIGAPILLLEGFFEESELELIGRHHLWTAVAADWQIDAIARAALPQPLKVWLKLDSGMHRLGFAPGDYHAAWQRLHALPQVEEVVLMSHFARADELDSARTGEQLAVQAQAMPACRRS
jgi:D-amino-acid dehydrogenase